MSGFALQPRHIADFHSQGFFIAEQLLDADEIDLLRNIARADHALETRAASRADGEGGAVKLVVSNELPDDTIYGAIVRSRRIVEPMEQLARRRGLSLPSQDDPQGSPRRRRVGVASGLRLLVRQRLPVPDLASCMIAVDRATRENGCLQVLPGSHRIGRIDHGKVGDQTGADPERVGSRSQRLERVYCELEPGSAIFFHCNLLAPLRPEQKRPPALGVHLLLQREAQRSVQGIAAPALCAAGNLGGRPRGRNRPPTMGGECDDRRVDFSQLKRCRARHRLRLWSASHRPCRRPAFRGCTSGSNAGSPARWSTFRGGRRRMNIREHVLGRASAA